jgi:hypothetical protein
MGVNYAVIPVSDEPEFTENFAFCWLQSPKDEARERTEGPLADAIRARQVPQWLQTQGIEYDAVEHTGRYPSLNEILTTLKRADYVTPKQAGDSGSVIITNDFTDQISLLHLFDYSGNPAEPHRIWFEKGTPMTILHASIVLSRLCGPLIALPDSNGVPVLVQPDSDEMELVNSWPDL